MIRKSSIIMGILMLIIMGMVGCAPSSQAKNNKSTIPDLLNHFKKNGIEGKFKEKMAPVIGALEGGMFEGKDYEFEVYRYDNVDKTMNIEKTKVFAHPVNKNGYFILVIYRGDETRLLKLFNSF